MRRSLLFPLALALALVLAGCTSSGETDLDKDTDLAEDATELAGLFIDIERLEGSQRRHVTSDPNVADTDGDGLVDGEELHVRGTDPRDVDTDGDGLLDGGDIATANAPAEEWRAKGVIEFDGIFLGELDACETGKPTLRAHLWSSDLPFPDALGDGEEILGWDVELRGAVRHVTSDPCRPDTDGDSLLDHEEKTRGTDPRRADTDGDGVDDGFDADPLWDISLRFSDVAIEGSDAASARITITVGYQTIEILWPGNASASLQIDDATADREHLVVNGIISAQRGNGTQLALFPDPRGAILSFDALAGTASGAATEGDRLVFTGDEGTLSLRWAVARR